jgi:hypothetical protein
LWRNEQHWKAAEQLGITPTFDLFEALARVIFEVITATYEHNCDQPSPPSYCPSKPWHDKPATATNRVYGIEGRINYADNLAISFALLQSSASMVRVSSM